MARTTARGRTARGESTEPREDTPGHPALLWISPEARPVTRLSGDVVSLGRDSEADVELGGDQASRHHAELRRAGNSWKLVDLGSTNGTFVNGTRITEMTIDEGDLVRIGNAIAIVVYVDDHEEVEFLELAPGVLGGGTLARALAPALRAALTDLPIVVEGETGTGKERVARAIHELSGRAGDFIAVNCAAIPEALAESELFGHRKGAFTGADRPSPGCFRAADKGTLLLDEVTDLPSTVQAKLLRVLEQREVLPLGETRPVRVDVRIIAASQEPLHEAVAERRFRADLFARLEGMSVTLPPLRERIEDVPFLLRRTLEELGASSSPRLDPRLVEQLCLYDWPLNVRELIQLVRRLLATHGTHDVLEKRHLPDRFRELRWRAGKPAPRPRAQSTEPPAERARPVLTVRDEADLARLVDALRASGGNVARAAADVGISRQRAYRLIDAQDELDLQALRRQGPSS